MNRINKTLVRLKNIFFMDFHQFKLLFSNKSVKFYNFWETNGNYWFEDFIVSRKIDKKMNFFSVFGSPFLIKLTRGKKVFYTGENVSQTTINSMHHKNYSHHCLHQVDLAIGFEFIDHPNYLRFPNWIIREGFIAPNMSLCEIREKINRINSPEHRLDKNRVEFACIIASHDISGVRKQLVELCNEIDYTTCAGTFLNNNEALYEEFGNNKLDYLRQFRFNICPENSDCEGYVTEKIVESILAGCIPIYAGGKRKELVESELLNQGAFLYYERGKEDELKSQIQYLWENQTAYVEFAELQPFKDGAAEYIWDMLNDLEEGLRK